MNSPEHRNHMRRYEYLKDTLTAAQRERQFRPINLEGMDWRNYEKMVMWGEVNKFRAALDKPLLNFDKIEEVEQYACGHFDYTKKFALYCAELVLDSKVTL